MQIHIYDHPEQVGKAAALIIASQILRKPDSVLGLATGSSPIGCYRTLIRWYNEGLLDFSRCVSYNLDEYVGLPQAHPCSYHTFMRSELFDHINMKQFFLPNGNAEDLRAECLRYDAAIRDAEGIDVQLLGIGRNGHIGFNEPAKALVYGTQVVDLSDETIHDNRRFFDCEQDVPRRAISLGIGGIMGAREIVLLAMGHDKAEAIRQSVRGDINPSVQASILRTHPHVVYLLDKEAASLL